MSSSEAQPPEAIACARCKQPIAEGQRVEHRGAVYCLNCVGEALNSDEARRRPARHSVALAVVLSLVPGLGQMYNRQLVKGALVMVAFIVSMPLVVLPIPIFFWNLFDAYWTARWIRDTGSRTPPLFVPEWLNLKWPAAATPGQVPPPQPNQSGAVAPPWPGYPALPSESYRSPTAPAWGILLIALGILFLLHNYGVTWLTWDRMWPAALLALGIYLILSFALARREAPMLELAPASEPSALADTPQEERHE